MHVLLLAALFELTGCYAVWQWVRHGRSALWIAAGLAALGAFGWILAHAPAPMAGRAFAAYGGVYLAAAFAWYIVFERVRPDIWDATGVVLALLGAAVILYAPR